MLEDVKTLLLLILVFLAGCTHAIVREVKPTGCLEAHPLHPPKEAATVEYLERAQAPFRIEFRKALKAASERLWEQNTELSVTEPLKSRYSIAIGQDGTVQEFKAICELGIPEIDSEFAERMKNVKKLDPPPAGTGVFRAFFDIELDK